MPENRTTFRHPRGLYTLFFTEMWERFSFYGMRAILVLYMADAARGGLEMADSTATAIYGLYTAFVYLVALPGGWIADRVLGAQRAVWYGGLVIAAGHFTLAIPRVETFFAGLVMIIAGTGLLKPNISAIVGQLYPDGGAARDAGYTIFYMGINVGGLLGPFICSALGEKVNWHYGFAAAGVGMLFGLLQFRLTSHHLGEAGLRAANVAADPVVRRRIRAEMIAGSIVIFAIGAAIVTAVLLGIGPKVLAEYAKYVISGIAAVFLLGILAFGGLDADERKRVLVLSILFFASAVFWAGYEQGGSSLNLFAERHTQRTVIGYEVPAGWFQSLNPAFIIALSPLLAAFWIFLARRARNPSIPAKFSCGLILVGVGFFVMEMAARLIGSSQLVGPSWLVATFFIHTVGELCLSPVGLSAVSKLSPKRFLGQLMGLWFVSMSLGNLIAGLFAGEIVENIDAMPAQFHFLGLFSVGAGLILLAAVPLINRWVGKVE